MTKMKKETRKVLLKGIKEHRQLLRWLVYLQALVEQDLDAWDEIIKKEKINK